MKPAGTPGAGARGFFCARSGARGRGARRHERFPLVGQLARAVPVSLVSFALDFGALALLTEIAGLHYLLSAALSFLLGTTVSWLLSILWVFDVRRFSSRFAEYALFVFVGVVGLAINEVLLWAFTDGVGLHYLLSKLIAATLGFFWNFGMRKALLFR
jgi:putative flippase GtrA